MEGLTALTQDQKKEHEEETKELEKLNAELLEIKEKMKTLQGELEEIQNEKEALVTQLQEANDKQTEAEKLSKTQEKSIQDLNREKNDLEAEIRQKNDLIAEKDITMAAKEEDVKELERKLQELETNTNQTGNEAQDKIKKMEDKIAGLENDIKEKDTTTGKLEREKVDLENQIAALTDQNQALENEKNQIKLLKDGDTQLNAQAMAALEQEKDNLKKEVQSLNTISDVEKKRTNAIERELEEKEEELSELRSETEAAEEALLNATKNMDKDMSEELKEYDTVMSEGMKLVVTDNMREKLRKGEFKEFHDLVRMHPSKKEIYSNAALFLVLESMGGTWKMALQNNANKADSENYDEIITEKIIYDLRQWDSIGNQWVDMKYTSKDFQAFVAAFGLRDDAAGGNFYRPVAPPRTRTSASYKRPTQPEDAADAGGQ